jgi:hypothetical protein
MDNTNVTIVTGLWDLGRGNLGEGFGRNFDHYLARFEELLKTDINMYIHIPKELEEWVWQRRKEENTRVRIIEVEDFKNWFAFYEQTNQKRQDPQWYSAAGWLENAPQTKLEFYNPIVMSKMFMLNDASIFNPFNSEYFFWIDGGITNTVHWGYFSHDGVFRNLPYMYEIHNKFTFLSYPYEGGTEIHGFPREGMNKYCAVDSVDYVCRGGFFGGRKDHLNQINNLYYNYLQSSLNEGYMGTEESVFTIIAHRHEELVYRFEIGGDGLVWPFFEYLKDVKEKVKVTAKGKRPFSESKVSLYVITFNLPEVFQRLCERFEQVDRNFLDKPRKIVLNNSTDRTTDERYRELFEKYGFEEVKKDNIGIHRGRVWCAEHFHESDSEKMLFWEDDMLLSLPEEGLDKFGFRKYIPDLYNKITKISHETDYDFIKLSFCEFYGDNATCWPWYSIPQDVREKYFPGKTKLPVQGLDPNPPKNEFKHIHLMEGIAFVDEKSYACNWPSIFTKKGSYKVYLETPFAYPNEATTMSLTFQEMQKGKIRSAVLLASPITHDRQIYYNASERREN